MKDLVYEYQELLVSNETLSSLDRTIKLVENVAGYKFIYKEGDLLLKKIEKESSDVRSTWILAAVVEGNYNQGELDNIMLKKRIKREKIIEQKRIFNACAYLSNPELLKRYFRSEKRYALAVDSLILLFHQCYFVLLPRIASTDWKSERDSLITGFFELSQFVPSLNEKFRIQGLAYVAIHRVPEAIDSFKSSLDATHTDEHDYMTRLQTIWMFLLDHALFEEALELLLDSYPKILRQDLEEMSELIMQTLKEQEKYLTSKRDI